MSHGSQRYSGYQLHGSSRSPFLNARHSGVPLHAGNSSAVVYQGASPDLEPTSEGPERSYQRHVYPYPWTIYPGYGGHQSPQSVSPVNHASSVRHPHYGPGAPLSPHQHQLHHMPSPGAQTSPTQLASPRTSATGTGLGNNNNGVSGVPDESSAEQGSLKNQCEALVKHPLFPLLRLLLEKLEESTMTAVTPAVESINAELEAMARRIQQNHASITTSNPTIDDLMIQSVTVLRLHLFELEKVNELCRDFCDRYTACLRKNLHSDQILRADCFDGEGDSSPTQMSQLNSHDNHAHHPPLGGALPMPVSSHSTVYQMIPTTQGLIAQPLQVQVQMAVTDASPAHIPEHLSACNMMSPVSGSSHYDESEQSYHDDSSSPKGGKGNRRGILPKDAINVMKSWLFQHIAHPYPTEDEKRILSTQTRLSMLQVNNWFINARRRILQPMLDATNPAGHRPKKGMQSRPVDPFWSEATQPTNSGHVLSHGVISSHIRSHNMGEENEEDNEEDAEEDEEDEQYPPSSHH